MRRWVAFGAWVIAVCCGCGRIGFDSTGPVTGDSGSVTQSTIRLLAHTMINGTSNGLTTTAIDTTGASLIVVAECTWSTGTPTVPLDSENNVWEAGLGAYGSDSDPAIVKMFYAYGPATSTSHTFSDVGNDDLSVAVTAFSGTVDTPNVLDRAAGSTGTMPLQPGSVAPSEVGELLVTAACSGQSVATVIAIDDGFDLLDNVLNHAADGPEDMGAAYSVTTSLAPSAPSWTFTGDTNVAGAISSFAHP